jgi:dihydrofolate reductase
MRIKIVAFITLDGVVQAPGGPEEDTDGGFAHGGWSIPFFDEQVGGLFDAAMQGTEAMVFGRRTWQVSAPAWSAQSGEPFADAINAVAKYVVSDSLTDADMTWNTTLIRGDEALTRLRDLRATPGGDLLVMGSSTVARMLLSDGLVDELRLAIEPVIVGGGKSIFPTGGGLQSFDLVESQTSSTGVLLTTYRRATGT